MNVYPFDYRSDGVFARSTSAWYTRDDGLVVEVGPNIRRVIQRGALAQNWMWMEGARENFAPEPLHVPANQEVVAEVPTGETDTIGGMDSGGDSVSELFSTGSIAVVVSGSIYAKIYNTVGLTTAIGTILIVNGNPDGADDFIIDTVLWTRARCKGVSLSIAANKTLFFQSDDPPMLVWGACVEAGIGMASDARFPSQPILVTGIRAAESFIAGQLTTAFLAATGGPRAIRFSFTPDFASTDVVVPNEFVLASFDTGTPAQLLVIKLQATGPGTIRLLAGKPAGPFIATGNITFIAGQRLDVSWFLQAGSLTVGAIAAAGAPTTLLPCAVSVGCLGVGSVAFGLIGPLGFDFLDFTLTSIDQLTLNSVKVKFAFNVFGVITPADVLQFNPKGLKDALNPANYTIGGSPGLPAIQYIQPGDVASEVVIFFDGTLPPGSKVTISADNIVLSGVVPTPIYNGARAGADAFAVTGPGPGGLNFVAEVLVPGSAGEAATLELVRTDGPTKPGINGVEILSSNPATPVIKYSFIDGETTLEMESTITAVAGHLIRFVLPSTLKILGVVDENVFQFDASLGEEGITLSLIAFGAEVNAVTQARPTFPRVDLANPQTERDSAGEALGTFSVTDAGDLANDHGRAYLRKRIFRRLATMKSAFFHLPGYGLQPPAKKLFTPTTLRRLKLDVELQVKQEPGVVAARATVDELRPGIVALKLRVQDDNGSFELEGALDFTAE
jgi:hypothetical protein